jgi:AcrR family transcriptional regulator
MSPKSKDSAPAPRARARRPAPARRALYISGRNIFAERGFHGTTVDAIVDAAGLAKGAFYHHWHSKEELLHEIMAGVIALQADLADEATRWEGSPEASLDRFIQELFKVVVENRKEAKIFHAQVGMLERDDFADVRRTAGQFHDSVRTLISRGIDSGELREVESVELVTWVISGALSYAYRWWPLDEPHSPEEVGRMIGRLMMPGLKTNKSLDRFPADTT